MILQLGFDDAVDRANRNAHGGVVVSFTFDAGVLVDDVDGAVAFGDGFGRAIGNACAAGDAIFCDFHGHGCYS